MIELTLGAIAAALIARALGRAEDRAVDAGEGVLRRLLGLVRRRLGDGDEEGGRALERVEQAPRSEAEIAALAQLLDRRLEREPEFRREVGALVEEAKAAGVDVGSITQVAYGDQSPQFGNVVGGEVNISYEGRGKPPRRLSD
jgi:hypothetical protein